MAIVDFVDTHVHYYDMQHPELHYAHWQPGVPHPSLGNQIQKLAERNYVAEDYIAEIRNANVNVTKAVHVQAAIGSKDPVKETEWLQEAADRTGFPHGIVAYSDLSHPDAEAELERHCQFANMRGIRDFSSGDYLVSSDFQRGFALLEKNNLVPSMSVQWQGMEKLLALASKFPNITIVVDHTGSPVERNPEYLEKWKKGMATVAQADNIRCKISALGMAEPNWTADGIKPYVLHCIETFGIDRAFFGSNWPVDWLFSTYDYLVDAYLEITADFTDEERTALFSRNAETIYNI